LDGRHGVHNRCGKRPGIPLRHGQHIVHVPPRVVVRVDGLHDPVQRSAVGAVGAQHPGRGVDGVGRIVRAEAMPLVGMDRVGRERRGLELHRALGTAVADRPVHVSGSRTAVARLDRADRGQYLPGQARAGLGGSGIEGQVPGRDVGQGLRGWRGGRRKPRQRGLRNGGEHHAGRRDGKHQCTFHF
jgi:hypothetical protein